MRKYFLNEVEEQFPRLYEDSILSLLFDEKDYAHLKSKFEVIDFAENHNIMTEGQISDGIYIVLKNPATVSTKNDHETTDYGNVIPYRTLSTYAVLRSLPMNYSAYFKDSGTVLFVANLFLEEAKNKRPDHISYLMAITENIEIRNLAKTLEEIGCSKDFKIKFISGLEEQYYEPHTVLVYQNSKPDETYYILDGHCLFQKKQDLDQKVYQWPAQQRSWLLWQPFTDETFSTSVLKTTSKTKVLKFNKHTYDLLKNDYSDDIQKLNKYIIEGSVNQNLSSERDEEINLDEIFKKTRSKKLAFWQSYPWVHQADQMDCGPACLAMLSQYYGRKVSAQYWRQVMSTDRSGTSAFDLSQTAERNGFITASIELTDIRKLDPQFLPIVVLRKYHYVVIYEYHKNHLIIGDPGVGIIKMSIDEFHEGFENLAIIIKPNDEFDSLPEQKHKYKHFLSLFTDLKKEIAVSFLISFLMIILGLSTPLISQIFIDDVLVRKDINWMWFCFGAGFLIATSQAALSWAKTYYSNYLSSKLDYKMHSLLLKKILDIPYKFHSEKHVGDFTKRFHELATVKNFFLHTSEDVVLSLLSAIIYSLVLLAYAPSVAIMAFATLPIFALISWFGGKKLVQINQEIFRHSAESESFLTDLIKGIAAIKSIGAELSSRWRYEEKLIKLLKLGRTYELHAETVNTVFHLYSSLVRYALTGLCVLLAVWGELTAGQVLAVTIIAFNLFDPLLRITDQFGEIQHIFSVFDRINDIFLIKDEYSNKKGRLIPDQFKGEIEFKDVWFRYGAESSEWVLKGVNFKIEAGQKVSVIGPSGSGKSTLVGLLNRMYEPTRGQILIDGRNYLNYDIHWLRQKIGILQQDSPLFSGSIMENIAFSKPEFDLAEVTIAAEKANAHDFIELKPNGYEYFLTHGGQGLSCGEKQRIALARTLYMNPKILLLDEATSALDGETEETLIQNLNKFNKDATLLNIAHRYSAAVFCEYALVIAKGKVVGFGTHEELANSNIIYQKLFSRYIAAKSLTHKKEAA